MEYYWKAQWPWAEGQTHTRTGSQFNRGRSFLGGYAVDYYYNKELQPLINGVSQDSNQR